MLTIAIAMGICSLLCLLCCIWAAKKGNMGWAVILYLATILSFTLGAIFYGDYNRGKYPEMYKAKGVVVEPLSDTTTVEINGQTYILIKIEDLGED